MRLRTITSVTSLLAIAAQLAAFGVPRLRGSDRSYPPEGGAPNYTVAGEPGGAKPPDPLSAGPFPVGVTTTVFVDSSRTDNFTKQPRTLVTEIWYPATDEAKQMPKNKYSDFIPGGVTPEIDALIAKTYKINASEVDKLYWNESHRNAPLRAGRFPLVVFSHGNGGSRHQNTFWCDYVASHGYYLKDQKEYGTILSENHWPDTILWDVRNAPDRQ